VTSTDTYAQRVIELVAKQLNIAPNKVSRTDTMESLGADSLDRVEIVMRLEEEFGVEIDDQKAEEMNKVNDVIDYVTQLATTKKNSDIVSEKM